MMDKSGLYCVKLMKLLPYCDYCGKVILNYHKMKNGYNIYKAVQRKRLKIGKYLTKRKRFLIFLDSLFMILMFRSYVTMSMRLLFCNQEHKDLFASKIGLRKRLT